MTIEPNTPAARAAVNHAPVISVGATVDIVVANQPEGSISVFQGDGTGGFGAGTTTGVGAGSTASVALGDLNRDGYLDAVVSTFDSNGFFVMAGDGLGGFTQYTAALADTGPTLALLGDVNNDGFLDVITTNSGANNVSVFLGDGAGGFGDQTRVATGVNPIGAALADVNDDGYLDIITANASGGSVSVLLGNGLGGFNNAGDIVLGGAPRAIAIADLDGDGFLDAMVADQRNGGVVILKGDGDGGFFPTSFLNTGFGAVHVALGDIDNNGTIDALVSNFGDNSVSVLLNDGHGSFTHGQTYTGLAGPFQTALADLDGDGDLDAVISTYNSNSIHILKNDGSGTFVETATAVTGNGPNGVALGNVDSDPAAHTSTTLEDTTLVFSTANHNAIQVSDVDGGILTVTLSVAHGVLTLSGTDDVTVTAGEGGNAATLTFSGTQAAVNAALNGLTYQPDANYNGSDAVSISVTDEGNVVAGVDPMTTNGSAPITVTPVNDAPTLTATGVADATYTEGGDATDLFSNVAVSTVEDGQYIYKTTLTVSGVSDGASEALVIDGVAVSLTNGNSGGTSSVLYSVSVVAGVATVTLSNGLGASAATVQGIIDGLAYQNTSVNPTGGTRTITLTSIQDSGGTANGGQDTATVSIGATVNVVPVNQEPTAHDDVLAIAQRATAYGNVLTNDTDPESDTLSVTGFSHGLAIAAPGGSILGEHGTLTVNANGSYRYVAGVEGAIAVGATATDLFDYSISDGKGGVDTAHLTVTVTGLATGTAGANTFLMTGPGTYAAGLGGDDTYIVDSQTDVVYEKVNGGNDTVKTSVSYALGSAGEIEHLQTTNALGTAAINLTGNKFDNEITGNAGANLLNGGGGTDTLIGGAGNDRYIVDGDDKVVESANGGIDTVYATSSLTLSANVENVRAYGPSTDGGVSLTGNTLANALYGGNGADTLIGGAGDDKYFVGADDTVVETSNSGVDTVYAGVSFTLSDNVERLIAYGVGSGDGLTLTGNSGANSILGGAGADTIDGGGGADKVYGYGGNDTFSFTHLGTGATTIMDFAAGDKIQLDSSVFTALHSGGLDPAEFANIASAKPGPDAHILYNATNGALFYDADGLGGEKPIVIAVLANHYALTAADIGIFDPVTS